MRLVDDHDGSLGLAAQVRDQILRGLALETPRP